jgi:hypothetical protein
MPKGDYYFTLYYQRLLTSTVGWKDSELGAYLRLLIYQFDKGSIPSDLSSIARIAPSAKKHWPLLSTKFVDDGNGGLINRFMEEVRGDVNAKKERSRLNGMNGGRPNIVKPGQLRFYLIECFNDHERFYKAGITDKSIQSRYSTSTGGSRAMPYSFNVIQEFLCDHSLALLIEETLYKTCEHYIPTLKFGGHKECYVMSENVLQTISQTITQNNPVGFEQSDKIIGNDQKSESKIDSTAINGRSKNETHVLPQYSDNQSEKKPTGFSEVNLNGTQKKAIPLTTNHNTAAAAVLLNSEIVNEVFSEVWKDQAWREQLCIGLTIKNEADLKKWLSQFNASVTGSQIEDFTAIRYKRMVRGWIIKQQQKNVTVDKLTETKEPSQNHRLKKIS